MTEHVWRFISWIGTLKSPEVEITLEIERNLYDNDDMRKAKHEKDDAPFWKLFGKLCIQ